MTDHTYRLKPPTVKAFQISSDDNQNTPAWLMDALFHGVVIPGPGGQLTVKGLNGVVIGKVGDWLVSEGGRFGVIPDATFQRKYEKAE
jgi:hypothetical protein